MRHSFSPFHPALFSLTFFILSLPHSASPFAGTLFPEPAAAAGDYAWSYVQAEFNGDGRPDLAALSRRAEDGAYELSVLLGADRDDRFDVRRQPLQGEPFNMAAGDVNGDGRQDLIVGRREGEFSVLLGLGAGAFADEAPAPALSGLVTLPRVMVVGDFNEDGAEDLVARGYAADVTYRGLLLVALADGRGGFGAPSVTPLEGGSQQVAAGDLDGDGHQDLVLGETSLYEPILLVLRGTGQGSFIPGETLELSRYVDQLLVTDLEADGRDDIVAAADRLTVWRSLAAGGFEVVMGAEINVYVLGIVAADFNRDSRVDLLVADYEGARFYRGLGGGLFAREGPVDCGGSLPGVDFTTDGNPDVACEVWPGHIYVLEGHGDGTFGEERTGYPMDEIPADVALADFNGDGRLDAAVVNYSAGGGTVLLGRGDGSFEAGARLTAGPGALRIAAADIDHNGWPDVAMAHSGGVTIHLGTGGGTFQPPLEILVAEQPRFLRLGQVDGSGWLDVVLETDRLVWVFVDRGEGAFVQAAGFPSGDSRWSFHVGDFNNDGFDDLARLNLTFPPIPGESARIQVLLGGEENVFTRGASTAGAGGFFQTGGAGDFDGDGTLDVVIASPEAMVVFKGRGDGSFIERYGRPISDFYPRVADMNADGRMDLLHGLRILPGNGDGTFQDEDVYFFTGFRTAHGDFNGDGRIDVLAAEYDCPEPDPECQRGIVRVVLNQGPYPVREVRVDVKPGDDSNVVNLASRGTVPAAILGQDDFEASSIDPATVRLSGAPAASSGRVGTPLCRLEDVNADGEADLLCQFRIGELEVAPDATLLMLEAATYEGRPLRGQDSVRIVRRRLRAP